MGNQRWIGTYDQSWDLSPSPGGIFWFYPDGNKIEIVPPSGVFGIGNKTSFVKWWRGTNKRLHMCGGHTDNLVLLENDTIVKSGIPDFSQVLTGANVSASAGPGLTGTCVVYLRWRDDDMERIGGLSNGVTVTLSNQQLSFSGISTTPGDDSVDQVEVWVSISGGEIRRFQAFSIASSFTTTELVTGETDDEGLFTRFPVCKYNAVYHDRQAMAGDASQPQRVYFSQRGQLEQYGGLFFDTRMGEPVRGIYVVRDSLIVQTDSSHYVIQGFDGTDMSINVLSPSIGALGHHSVVIVEDVAFFLSKHGLCVCDGTSIKKLGVNDFCATWSAEQHWSLFDGSRFGFMIHDAESKIIKYKTPRGTRFSPESGFPSANNAGIEWVFDYYDYINGTGNVRMSIDTCAELSTTEPTASAMLMDTDGSLRLFTGHASGKIAMDNIYGLNDIDHVFEYVWQSPQIELAKPGDDADCATVIKPWVHIMNEDVAIQWTLFAGNSYDWQAEKIDDLSGGRELGGTIPAQAATLGSAVRVYNDRFLINSEPSSGATVSILLRKPASITESEHEAYNGSPKRFDGLSFLAPTFAVRGWGFTYRIAGEHSRSVRPY